MDMLLHGQSQQKTNRKKRLTQEQVWLLERTFTTNKKLQPEIKVQLANQLGVPPRQIAIWYQNKRARWRTQTLELDYSTTQVRLENALSDKKRLEKQVVCLQQELVKAKEMLIALNNQQGGVGPDATPPTNINHVVSNSNSSCDEVGSCNLHEECSNNGEVKELQFDELYACLLGNQSDA